MSDIVSMFEEKVNRMMDKMYGDKPSELKTISKLAMMNKDINSPDVVSILEQIREDKKREQEMLLEEMTCTLDANGNVVPLETLKPVELTKELSPRQQEIKVKYHDN
jgi:hypothetical protein